MSGPGGPGGGVGARGGAGPQRGLALTAACLPQVRRVLQRLRGPAASPRPALQPRVPRQVCRQMVKGTSRGGFGVLWAALVPCGAEHRALRMPPAPGRASGASGAAGPLLTPVSPCPRRRTARAPSAGRTRRRCSGRRTEAGGRCAAQFARGRGRRARGGGRCPLPGPDRALTPPPQSLSSDVVSIEQPGLPASPPPPPWLGLGRTPARRAPGAPNRVVPVAGGAWPRPPHSKDAVVAPSLSRSLYSARKLFFFPFFFFFRFFFHPSVSFPFPLRFWFRGRSTRRHAAPPLGVARGGRGEERGGSAAGWGPAAPRGTAGGAGRRGAAVAGHQQPGATPGHRRLRPASPGAPRRAVPAARCPSQVGGWCWHGPSPCPRSFPPGAGARGARRGSQGQQGAPWPCGSPPISPPGPARRVPAVVTRMSPERPRPAGWTAQRGAGGRGEVYP